MQTYREVSVNILLKYYTLNLTKYIFKNIYLMLTALDLVRDNQGLTPLSEYIVYNCWTSVNEPLCLSNIFQQNITSLCDFLSHELLCGCTGYPKKERLPAFLSVREIIFHLKSDYIILYFHWLLQVALISG